MVFVISIAIIVAFIVGYIVIKKMPRQPGEPVNNNNDLNPLPPDAGPERHRPKY